jgi:hypothetical protein
MILPGHLAAGYLVAKAVLATHREISATETHKLILLGIFSGWIPDSDLIYYFAKDKSFKFQDGTTHRSYITHTPFFWTMVGAVAGLLTHSFLVFLVLSLGAASHIFLDSFGSGHGLMWLWPFSTKKFSFVKFKEVNPQKENLILYYGLLFKEYARHITFWLEIIITILALWIMYN